MTKDDNKFDYVYIRFMQHEVMKLQRLCFLCNCRFEGWYKYYNIKVYKVYYPNVESFGKIKDVMELESTAFSYTWDSREYLKEVLNDKR